MGAAFLWGFVGGAALLLGAAIAYLWDMPSKVLGGIIAFGSGVLISAVAFELVDEANNTTDGKWAVAVGLLAGAVVLATAVTLAVARAAAAAGHPWPLA